MKATGVSPGPRPAYVDQGPQERPIEVDLPEQVGGINPVDAQKIANDRVTEEISGDSARSRTGPKDLSRKLEREHDPNLQHLQHQLLQNVGSTVSPEAAGTTSAGDAKGLEAKRAQGSGWRVHDDHVELDRREELQRELKNERKKGAVSEVGDPDKLRREIEQLRGEARNYRGAADELDRDRTVQSNEDATKWRNAGQGADRDADKLEPEERKLRAEKAKRAVVTE
ncbi:MAG: hypothetical protein HY791_09810 [Deltaproteobacteria bacterium]|nr:hypothetical protein [Deltaproteobacteria bacterium]